MYFLSVAQPYGHLMRKQKCQPFFCLSINWSRDLQFGFCACDKLRDKQRVVISVTPSFVCMTVRKKGRCPRLQYLVSFTAHLRACIVNPYNGGTAAVVSCKVVVYWSCSDELSVCLCNVQHAHLSLYRVVISKKKKNNISTLYLLNAINPTYIFLLDVVT